jgi:hypothetical protein
MDRQKPDEFIWRVFIGSKSESNRFQILLTNTLHTFMIIYVLRFFSLSLVRDIKRGHSQPHKVTFLTTAHVPLSPRLFLGIVILVTSSKAKATSVI